MGFETTLIFGLGIIIGIALTFLVGWVYLKRTLKFYDSTLEERRKTLEQESKTAAANLVRKAELDIEKRSLELEREWDSKNAEAKRLNDKAEDQLLTLEKERELVDRRRKELESKYDEFESFVEKTRLLSADYRKKLQDVSGMTDAQAKEELINEVERESSEELRLIKSERLQRAESEIETEAKGILVSCMQRLSSAPHEDITATIVHLPSDDMKGRIIGREGRNIKSFESTTGTTLLIDETPDSVLVSSFDPVRREIARIALEALIKDGRIHPTSIEEATKKATEEVQQSVLETGEDALRRLRLNRMHPEVVRAVGRMKFRLANNQNMLEHSLEVANLASLMASELGFDTEIAKRCGLLHDIGKVLSEEHEGSHAKAGANFIRRFGKEDDRVINAIEGHHNEVEAISPFVGLLMTADSVSALRPGARADSMDGYIQRIKHLEDLALSMDGVTEAYAIQAGREIRIIVAPNKLDSDGASLIARKVRRKIEEELQYPGTIKVTVIREERYTEVAK